MEATLVAADGAVLPFRPASFDVTVSVEALEHSRDQAGFVHSCLDSVGVEGLVAVVTANRWSVAPQPSVRLVGAGFLPRRWAPAYVRLRRHTSWEHLRILSRAELRGLVGPRADVTVGPAALPPPPLAAGLARRAVHRVHDRLARWPGARVAVGAVGPFLEVRRGRP
jgi:SAM-dependent methyltransferase